jgi:putative FmdB family regulatory protein
MPLYEYYCANCNVEFEALRPAARAHEPVACKTCGQNGERQLSTFSFKSNTFTAPKLKPATRARRSYMVGDSTIVGDSTEGPTSP